MNFLSFARVLGSSAIVCSSLMIAGCGGSGSPAPAAQATAIQVAPSVTVQPKAQSVENGKAATFTVSAAGTGPLSYQWLRNGSAIEGATAASYTIPAVSLADSADVLRVTVKNDKGTVTSDAAVLLVKGVGARVLAGNNAETSLARVDGVGKEARLQEPGAMTIDNAGNLLVVETERQAIRKVTPTGVVTTWFNAAAQGAAVSFPRAIAAGTNGAVYVTDGATKERATAVRKIAADGAVSTIVFASDPGDPRGTDGIALPARYTALAADAAGNLYVASEVTRAGEDTCSSCMIRSMVRKVAPDGKVSVLLALDRAPLSRYVFTALAADKAGNVYALNEEQLYKIDAAGTVSTVMRNETLYINALAVDAAGNLFFTGMEFSGRASDWAAGAIGKVTPQGTLQVLADPSRDARFATPASLDSSNAIAVDAAGAIYMSRYRTIRKLVLP